MGRLLIDSLVMFMCALSLGPSIYITYFTVRGIAFRKSAKQRVAGAPWSRVLVFVPAHNESSGIIECLQSICNQDYPPALFRLIVIADNCTDDTASVARQFGSEVWERKDADLQGKGHALAWAFEQAKAIDYEFAIVIDADSTMNREFLAHISDNHDALIKTGIEAVALQGRYEFKNTSASPNGFNALTRASKAAENTFTYLPRSEMNLVNLLQGNGFAVTKEALERVPFLAGSVVEDAEYAIALALGGVSIRYVDRAVVTSRMTSRVQDATPQRMRWASGMFQLVGRSIPRLLVGAIRLRSWRLAEGALMLLCTSRMMLVYSTAIALVLTVLDWHNSPAKWAISALVLSCTLQGYYLWCVLKRSSDEELSSRSVLSIPFYWGFLWCVQVCAAAGFGRKQWKRTVR